MNYKFVIFLLMAFTASAQSKKYSFDYISEYDFQKNDTSAVRKMYLLTNTSDNSYNAILIEKDNEFSYLDFLDEKGIRASTLISTSKFFKGETISYDCPQVRTFKPYKSAIRGMETYVSKPDTAIAGKSYKQYSLQIDNGKIGETQRKGEATYIIESNTDFHKPFRFFAMFDEAFHADSSDFPNGIAREIFIKDSNKKSLINIYLLRNHAAYKKFLKIPGCE